MLYCYLYPHFSIMSSARTNLLLITQININPFFCSDSTSISSINLSCSWSYIKETPRDGAWPANCQGGSIKIASKKPPYWEFEAVCSVAMKDLKLNTRTSARIGLEPFGGSGFKQSRGINHSSIELYLNTSAMTGYIWRDIILFTLHTNTPTARLLIFFIHEALFLYIVFDNFRWSCE